MAQECAMALDHITVFIGGRDGVLEKLGGLLDGCIEGFGEV